jgi:nucleoside-diphosphate-sugar epimerase
LFENKKQNLIDSRLKVEDIILQNLSTLSIDGSIGRLFSFIGPRILSKDQYAVSSFLEQARRDKVIRIFGNPNTVRSYLSADDLSSWIYKSIQLDSKPAIMNFGSRIPVKIGDLASYIANKTNSSVELLSPDLPADIYVSDNSQTLDLLKVTEGIGWQEQIDGVIQS